MIGWIGTGLLLFSYVLLLFHTNLKWFLIVDIMASIILTIHAIIIVDIPFIIVNSFIAISLFLKFLKETA